MLISPGVLVQNICCILHESMKAAPLTNMRFRATVLDCAAQRVGMEKGGEGFKIFCCF